VSSCSAVEAKKVAELSGMSRADVSARVNTLERGGALSEDEPRTLVELLGKLTGHSVDFDARHRA
jgi:DNA-binding IclR family transcriptional regulator